MKIFINLWIKYSLIKEDIFRMKRFKLEKDLKQYKQINKKINKYINWANQVLLTFIFLLKDIIFLYDKIKDFTKFVKNISIYKFWTFTVILEKVGLLLLIWLLK